MSVLAFEEYVNSLRMTKTKPSSSFLKTNCTKLLDIRTNLISLRIGTNDHDPDSMAKKEAMKHLKPVSRGKLTKERPIDPDELIKAIAQIKTFEDYPHRARARGDPRHSSRY